MKSKKNFKNRPSTVAMAPKNICNRGNVYSL